LHSAQLPSAQPLTSPVPTKHMGPRKKGDALTPRSKVRGD
jgi:hypothetical protein